MEIIEGYADPGFIREAQKKMEIYTTPQAVIDYINRANVIIGNPPFITKTTRRAQP